VYVGYDNYNNRLAEPPLTVTEWLIDWLRQFTDVRLKQSGRPSMKMTKVKNLLKKGNLISFDKFVGKARHGKLTVLIFVGIFIALIYLNL